LLQPPVAAAAAAAAAIKSTLAACLHDVRLKTAGSPLHTAGSKQMPRLKGLSKEERKSQGVLLLQRCVRGHIGRRAFWRHRKLWIHARESRQATKVQKVFRGHAARAMYQKLHSVHAFMQFMAAKKGGKFSKGMSSQQLELYAVCLVQAAWRRKMAYRAAVRRRRLMRFLEYLRSKDVKGKKAAGSGGGLFGGKKKKADSSKKVVMQYLTPTSRYPTVACLQQLSMQQVQQLLSSLLHRVFKGALGRLRFKRVEYKAKHGDYTAKIIKVQAFQRGRVVRKQVCHAPPSHPHWLLHKGPHARAGAGAAAKRALKNAGCAHVQAGGVPLLQHVAQRVAGVQVRRTHPPSPARIFLQPHTLALMVAAHILLHSRRWLQVQAAGADALYGGVDEAAAAQGLEQHAGGG